MYVWGKGVLLRSTKIWHYYKSRMKSSNWWIRSNYVSSTVIYCTTPSLVSFCPCKLKYKYIVMTWALVYGFLGHDVYSKLHCCKPHNISFLSIRQHLLYHAHNVRGTRVHLVTHAHTWAMIAYICNVGTELKWFGAQNVPYFNILIFTKTCTI